MNTIHGKEFVSKWSHDNIDCRIEPQSDAFFDVVFKYGGKINSLNIVPDKLNLHRMMRAYANEMHDFRYGEPDKNNEHSIITTPEQSAKFIEMLAVHLMACLGAVMGMYGSRMATEYAMWYYRTRSGEIEYTMCVQQQVAQFLIEDSMLAPDIKFTVPKWDARSIHDDKE